MSLNECHLFDVLDKPHPKCISLLTGKPPENLDVASDIEYRMSELEQYNIRLQKRVEQMQLLKYRLMEAMNPPEW